MSKVYTEVKWTKVESSAIDAVSYKDGDVLIRFKNGLEYAYIAVPFEIYLEMIQAESVGKYHAHKIKNQFDFVKLF